MKLNEVAFDYDAVENESLLYQIVKDLLLSGKDLNIDADFPNTLSPGRSKAEGQIISLSRTGSHIHWRMTVRSWADADKTFIFELPTFDDRFTIEQRKGIATLVNV